MSAYTGGGSLTWQMALESSAFNAGLQSSIAQMGYTAQAAKGLESSLKGLATIAFAGTVLGIGAITAAIYVSISAAAEWQKQMLDVAQLANIKINTPAGKAEYNALSNQLMTTYVNKPIKEEDLFKAAAPYAAAGYKDTATTKTLTNLTDATAMWHETSGVATDDISNMIISLAAINPTAVTAAGGIDKWANQVMSSMTQAANSGKITSAELVKGMTEAGGSLNKWGLQNQIPEQIALLETMSQFGLDSSSWKTTLSSQVSGPGLTGPSAMTSDLSSALAKMGIDLPAVTITQDVGKNGKLLKPKVTQNKYTGMDIAAQLMGYDSSDAFMAEFDKDAPNLMIKLYDKISTLNMPSLQKNQLYGLVLGERAAREAPKMAGVDAGKFYNDQLAGINVEYEKGSLAAELYALKMTGLAAQWDLLGNRGNAVKILFGRIFEGPATAGVKSFSDKLMSVYEWLNKIATMSTTNGVLDSWKAVGMVVDDVKNKLIEMGAGTALTAGGLLIGLGLVKSGLMTAAGAAIELTTRLLEVAGVEVAKPIATLLGFIGPLAGIAVGIGVVAVGLGTIGYALDPGKFTYFNQIATEALNGIKTTALQLYDDISKGDFSAAATHLKDAFSNAYTWIKGIEWGKLGGEIGTMISDGAKAIIDTACKIGTWIYDQLNGWVNAGGPRLLGDSIAKTLVDGIKGLLGGDFGGAFGTAAAWASLALKIGEGLVGGIYAPVHIKLAEIHDLFWTSLATIVADAGVMGINIGDAIVTGMSGSTGNIVAIINNWITAAQDAWDKIHNWTSGGSSESSSSSSSSSSGYNGDNGDPSRGISAFGAPSATQSAMDAAAAKSQATLGVSYNSGGIDVNKKLDDIKTQLVLNEMSSGQSFKILTTSAIDTQNNGIKIQGEGAWDLGKVDTGAIGKAISDAITTPLGTFFGEKVYLVDPNDFKNAGSPSVNGPGTNSVTGTISTPVSKTFNKDVTSASDKVVNDFKQIAIDTSKYQTHTEEQKNSAWSKIYTDAMNIDPYGGHMADAVRLEEDRKSADAQAATNSAKQSDQIKQSTDYFKTGVDYSVKGFLSSFTTATDTGSKNLLDGLNGVGTVTKQASDYSSTQSYAASNYAKEALTLGGGAVRIGLTASGQEIAVIGQVAQANFTASGGKWVSDTVAGGVSINNSCVNGGSSIENSCAVGAGAISSALGSAVGTLTNLGGFFANGGKVGTGSSGSSGSSVGSIAGGLIDLSKVSTTNAPKVTGLSDNGYVVTYDPRTDTCEGLSFNAPDASLKTTDPFYLGLTSNNPYGSQDKEPGYGWNSVGQLPNGTSPTITPQTVSAVPIGDLKQAGGISINAAKESAVLTTSSGAKYKALSDSAALDLSKTLKGSANYSAQKIDDASDATIIANTRMLYDNAAANSGNVGNWLDCNDIIIGRNDEESVYWSGVQHEGAFNYLGANKTGNDLTVSSANTAAVSVTGAASAVDNAAVKFDANASALNGVLANLAVSVDGFRIVMDASGQAIGSMATNIMGLASRGGGNSIFPGQSISGGGAWVGTGSTAVGGNGYVDWGGTATSNAASGLPTYGSTGYNSTVGSFWGAKGALIDTPSHIIAGEKGRELLLPNNITELFMKLLSVGFNSEKSESSGPITIILEMDGAEITRVVSDRMKGNLNRRGFKSH